MKFNSLGKDGGKILFGRSWNSSHFQQLRNEYIEASLNRRKGRNSSKEEIEAHRTRYVPWKERKSYYSSENGAVQLTVPTDPETRMLFNRVYKSYEY